MTLAIPHATPPYLRIVPIFLRKRQFALLGIAVAELLVMLPAASGLVAARH